LGRSYDALHHRPVGRIETTSRVGHVVRIAARITCEPESLRLAERQVRLPLPAVRQTLDDARHESVVLVGIIEPVRPQEHPGARRIENWEDRQRAAVIALVLVRA
jgi:hypothetical protein